ncbi:MAG: hypothetical protein HYR84_15785 [Planctomycetes bacterium]|nr:hypothetical protein [Planctomycetota bacterium]
MNVLKSGTVVVTTKPLKKKRIFETFSSSQDKEEHNGAAYYVFKRNGEVTMVLHFASDRIVLVTRTAEAMKSFLEGKDKPPTDPAMKRAVRLASSGSYSFVVAVKGNHSVAAAAPGANFTNFRAVTGVFVTGTVDSKMQFEITGLFPNGDTAAKAKAEIEAFRDGKLDPRDGVPQGIQAREAKELFATIEQRGSELVVTGKAGAPIMQLVFLVQDLDLRAPEPPPKEDNPKTKKKGPPDPVEPEP